MEISSDGVNGVRIRVTSDLDLAGSRDLLHTVMSVAPGPLHEVILDLADVDFVDSSGLAVLIDAQARLLARQVRMTVVNPSTRFAELLELTGTAHLLTPGGE